MRDRAVQLGLPEREFWEMTVGEVTRWSEGAAHRHRSQLRDQAALDHTHALLLAKCIGIVFGSGGKFPRLEDSYPDLFREELQEEQRQAEEERRMAMSAARFVAFANAFNKKHGGAET